MKYLTPEIEALSKDTNQKSLILQSASCGIFQEIDYNKDTGKPVYQLQIQNQA